MILTKDEILYRIRNSRPPLVEGYVDLGVQLQPAGIDLTLRRIFSFKSYGVVDFSNKHRRTADLEEIPFDGDGAVKLAPGAYLVELNEWVNIPLDLAAIARPRSTLLRCGATVLTALWDPGYSGRSKVLLLVYNHNGLVLYRNARIAQMVFIKLTGKLASGYRGAYQYEGRDHT